MSKTTITIPEDLQEFIDQRVDECGYSSSREYILELIRNDQHGLDRLRQLLLEGALSPMDGPVDADYFEALRRRIAEDKLS